MKYKVQEAPALNLIPILDAIFIFIFFLLMSAQFLDIYEIGTDAPITMEVPTIQKNKKEPLNLTLELSNESILVKTGLNQKIKAKFKQKELLKLNQFLIKIKELHKDENSIILKPATNLKYQRIIAVIDHIKEVKEKNRYFSITNKKGEKKLSQTLFDQVIFNSAD